MKIKRKVFIAVAGLLTILFIIAFYNGVFETVQWEEKMEGGYCLAGLEFKGAYSKAGKFMKEVETKIKNKDMSMERGFGIYYDNPEHVKKEECRSFIGFILDKKDYKRMDELKSAGLKIDSIPVSRSVSAEFPIRNTFSYMIGPWKVYPVLSKHMDDKNYHADLTMEIYDTRNRKIIFLIQYH